MNLSALKQFIIKQNVYNYLEYQFLYVYIKYNEIYSSQRNIKKIIQLNNKFTIIRNNCFQNIH